MSPDDAYIKIDNADGVGPIEHVILHGARLVMQDADRVGEWDLPPALYAVAQSPLASSPEGLPEGLPDDLRAEITEHGSLGQQLAFAPLAINDQVWTTAEPARVLSKLARYAQKHPPRLDEDLPEEGRIIGLLFVSEAWMVAAATSDMDDAKRRALHRDLHQHPDRIEIRLIYGVDLAGYHYSIRQVRGQDEMTETVQGPGIDTGGREQMRGDIPDALEQLLAALTPAEPL